MSAPVQFLVAVDLGKLRDFSAITIVERYSYPDRWDPVLFCQLYAWKNVVRKIERLALGTSYPRVIARIEEWVSRLALRGPVTLLVDATGVGEAVVDSLRSAGLRCELVPITITAGEQATRGRHGWCVPKKDLMVSLQLLIARGELVIPRDLELRERLADELASIDTSLRAAGTRHDDLVLSLSLAAWRLASRKRAGERGESLVF